MKWFVVAAFISSISGCPSPPTCSEQASDHQCGVNETTACDDPEGQGAPTCVCASGFIVANRTCVSILELDAKCCHCLATHLDGPEGNQFSSPCVPDEDQCKEALDNGGSISSAPSCTHSTCAGDCFFLVPS